MSEATLWPQIVRWCLALFVFVFSLLLIWRVSLRLRSLWQVVAPTFGDDTGARLIGLGIASAAFPSVAQTVVAWLWHMAVALLFVVPSTLAADPGFDLDLKEHGAASAISHLISRTSAAIGNIFSLSESSALPVANLILMMALWAMMGRLFQSVPAGDPRGVSRLRKLYEQVNEGRRRDLALFVILAGGTFLSIAAITALPELIHPGALPANVTVDRLKQRLTELQLTDDQFAKKYPDKVTTYDPFESLRKVIEAGRTDAKTLAPHAALILGQAIKDLDFQESQRQQLFGYWGELRDAALIELRRAMNDGLSKYESNVDRIGARQTTDQFHDIDQWFSHAQNDWQQQLGTCVKSMLTMDQAWATWSNAEINALSENSAEETARVSGVGNNLFIPIAAVHQSCAQRPVAEPVPARRPLGDNLGVFGFVARWLLETESLSLTLIIGMLGFGLLGSAVSSFIRDRKRGAEGKPQIGDLPTVVIRGVSAAMVIFLAVEGGLAIFSSNESNPNPYVLLFTCLVSAAFSGDAWEWARTRALGNLGAPSPDAAVQQSIEVTHHETTDTASIETKSPPPPEPPR